MSLINDALKRAKKAQQDNPPPPPPLQLRPAEPPAPRRAVPVVLLLLALVIVIAAGGLLLWTVARQSAPVLRVDARTVTPPPPAAEEIPKASDVSSARAEVVVPLTTESQPAAAVAPALTTDETLPGQPQTNGLPVAAAAEPLKPAALKLQAILYNPTRPSALINGRTVFQGDRVGESRVLVINPEGVTLGSATITNVLILGE